MPRRSHQEIALSIFLSLWLAVTPALAGSMTLLGAGGPSAAGGGLMLDGITTGIKVAYSTRKLLTAYAGNAVQVQRLSDSTTQNVGFASGVLDTTSLTTFCTGTTCRVITWYDQSGGGFNLTQGTFANAPIIFQAGATVFLNSTRPAIVSVNGSNIFLGNASLSPNPTNTQFINCVAMNAGHANSAIVGGTASNNFYLRIGGGTLKTEILASITASLGTSSTAGSASGSVYEAQYNSSTGVGSFWTDAAATGTFTSAHTFAGASTFQTFYDTPSADTGDMTMGELVIYDLVGGIPSGSRTAIEANQKAYWGTP